MDELNFTTNVYQIVHVVEVKLTLQNNINYCFRKVL